MSATAKSLPVTTVSIAMLGKFTLQTSEAALSDEVNRSLKLWNVLAYLILHRNRAVSQTELLDIFWADDRGANPANALKTLLYRVRALLEPLFGPAVEPILSRRGAYLWNPSITCDLDMDRFEVLCHRIADPSVESDKALALCQKVMALYSGDLLPKLGQQSWLTPLVVHCHTLYLTIVKTMANLLDVRERFVEMQQTVEAACALDPLDEELHILAVRALLRQGKNAAALSHYEEATAQLHRNLGVRPSAELRGLYQEIMSVEKAQETDLGVILRDLKEAAARPGAFFCAFGFFEEIYRLEARRATRSGVGTQLCLVTVALPGGGLPPLSVLAVTMDQLQAVLMQTLRRGDVVSRFSAAQFVILLPSANFEDSSIIMDRVVSAFYEQHRRNFLKLTARICELEFN